MVHEAQMWSLFSGNNTLQCKTLWDLKKNGKINKKWENKQKMEDAELNVVL